MTEFRSSGKRYGNIEQLREYLRSLPPSTPVQLRTNLSIYNVTAEEALAMLHPEPSVILDQTGRPIMPVKYRVGP